MVHKKQSTKAIAKAAVAITTQTKCENEAWAVGCACERWKNYAHKIAVEQKHDISTLHSESAHKHKVLKVFADQIELHQVNAYFLSHSLNLNLNLYPYNSFTLPDSQFGSTLTHSYVSFEFRSHGSTYVLQNLYINCVCMTWIRRFTLLKMCSKYPKCRM